jgi:SAM-dependent methyltransferase
MDRDRRLTRGRTGVVGSSATGYGERRMDRQEYWRQRYAEIRPEWTPTTAIYARLVDGLIGDDTRVLDIGCGHADLVGPSLVRGGRAVGIDRDTEALAANEAIHLRIGADAERLPFSPGSFDLVLMAWVLEHLPRPLRAFREIRRVLIPGGRVVFVTPNSWNYNAWLIRMVPNAFHAAFTSRLYGRLAKDPYPTRYRLNSIRRLGATLPDLGYERERIVLNGDPTYIAFNEPLFRIATLLEGLYDLPPLRRARVHIIGVYRTVSTGPR